MSGCILADFQHDDDARVVRCLLWIILYSKSSSMVVLLQTWSEEELLSPYRPDCVTLKPDCICSVPRLLSENKPRFLIYKPRLTYISRD